ncbi:unnamed protein product [Macrosiphum euphorbiae]|uniref:Uncharacterized protein n=1 Tax=Macrosiphum euphorbiae TaxID=13131 RepID=A0AAV0XTB4_9HEMI|nr:unnamed protein product [Macrosiphum euphorbiae]
MSLTLLMGGSILYTLEQPPQESPLDVSAYGRRQAVRYNLLILTLAMKVTYSWIIYSCLIFGTGILCERKLERRQAVSSISENTVDKFNCPNGQFIEWSLLCDGHEDCSDGSDETKELCALYEFETNMTMDCGRVHNMKNQVTPEEADKSIIELAPWAVAVYEENKNYKGEKIFLFIEPASIIAPNIAISYG